MEIITGSTPVSYTHLNEIANFFEVYKSLEHKNTTLSNTLGREAALQIIRETLYTYECHFCGRME